MSLWREKQKWDSQILIYEITLGKSLLFTVDQKKVIQLGWWGALTKCSPFLFRELEIDWINDQEGS